MYSIAFPNMLAKSNIKLYDNHDATLSNLKLLLLSDKYGLFGDPYFGTNLKKLLFEQNNLILRDLVVDEIYTAIITFMPQIVVERKNITVTSTRASIQVQIKCTNLLDYQTDLYVINLTETEEI